MAFVLVLVAVPQASAATTRWAEPGGNGPEPCAVSDPCDLQTAVEAVAVQDGDEVILKPGTYELGAANVSINDAISVHGQTGQARPVLNGTTFTLQLLDSGAMVSDLEVRGTGAVFDAAAGIADRIVVKATGSSGSACQASGAVVIRNSVCWSTGDNGKAITTDAIEASYTVTLRSVTAVSTGTVSEGIRVVAPNSGTKVINAKGVIARGTQTDVETSQNGSATATATLDHSNYATTLGNVTAPNTSSNQTAGPLFVDAANGDFHQTSLSPTIGAGAGDGSTGQQDFDRQDRIICDQIDIGADEFFSTDTDSDGICDLEDNCPSAQNVNQLDTDGDDLGDARDPDDDNDDVADGADTCPLVAGNGADGCPTEPRTDITKHPERRTTKRGATFKFEADLPGATFECKLDRKRWKACESPFRKRVKPGRHGFRVRATDAGMTDATPAAFRWKVLSD